MLLVEGGRNASRSNLETRCCRQEEQLHGVDLALAMHDWPPGTTCLQTWDTQQQRLPVGPSPQAPLAHTTGKHGCS